MMPWEKTTPSPADIPALVAHAEAVRYDYNSSRWVGDISRETARAIVRALVFAADDLARSIPASIALAGDAAHTREAEGPPSSADDPVKAYSAWLADELTARDQVAATVSGAATLVGQATGAAHALMEYTFSDTDAVPSSQVAGRQ